MDQAVVPGSSRSSSPTSIFFPFRQEAARGNRRRSGWSSGESEESETEESEGEWEQSDGEGEEAVEEPGWIGDCEQTWEGDVIDGYGVMRSEQENQITGRRTSRVYAGRFQCQVPHGYGVERCERTGQNRRGRWVHGSLHGLGELSFPDGGVYGGTFNNGEPDGPGAVWCPGDEMPTQGLTRLVDGGWRTDACACWPPALQLELERVLVRAARAEERGKLVAERFQLEARLRVLEAQLRALGSSTSTV